jgi:uncharacterized protein YkwD
MGLGDRTSSSSRFERLSPLQLGLAAVVLVLLFAGGGRALQLSHRPLQPLYAKGDPWVAYLADERTCPGAESTTAPLAQQAETMVCLIDYARRVHGLAPLLVAPILSAAAKLKGDRIVRCGNFDHAPCGPNSLDVANEVDYLGAWGENLYIAEGRFGAPRPALDGWLNSPEHRENLFHADWRIQSIYVTKPGSFPGFRDSTLWVSEFGDR